MASIVRLLPPFVGRRVGRGWLLGLALPWLAGVLLAASPAVAAHPPPAPDSLTAAAPGSPTLDTPPAEPPPPATPATAALVCLAVLALPGVLVARGSRRAGALAAAALLVWFAAETAIHSAHHLGDPGGTERCSVFTASQHLSGLDPEPVGPALERPAATTIMPPASPVAAARVVLDAEQARAPPVSAA
jgi:hypothetical protein